MMTYWKELTALASSAFILTSCAPEKKETPPAPPPAVAPAPVAPAPTPPIMPPEKPKEGLTPQEKDRLIIEENEIEPFPG
jgi:hypothetical protein